MARADGAVVTNNEELARYELVIDGAVVAIADYMIDGDLVLFPHTEVDRSRRGQGLGLVLVRGALDDVRTTGRKVVPQCWYVAEVMNGDPAYHSLLAG